MKINTVKGDSMEILLRQLGAKKITKCSGNLYFIKFVLDNNFKVLYTYNINDKNKYFLQRVEPYPIPQGTFSSEIKVVDFIKKDLRKFKQGLKSEHFDHFLEATSSANKFIQELDDYYLNYQFNEDVLEDSITDSLIKINKDIEELNKKIIELKNNSKKINGNDKKKHIIK